MRWTPSEIAAATGGRLESGGSAPDEASVVMVAIDSRTVGPGGLFVAIRAERDGHDFVGAAVAAGAAAVLISEPRVLTELPPTAVAVAAVVVDETGSALLRLGRAARDRLDGRPVVGITGSVGKTSTKDLMAAALSSHLVTVASEKSFNNELGVPLTLANAPDATQVAVLEMGSRGPGHIALLCRTARPTIGVVTAVAAAHTEMFGGIEGVARAKGELVESLPADGHAVLNGDDPNVAAMAHRTQAAVISYSVTGDPAAQVVAEHIEMDDQLRPSFDLKSPWGSLPVTLEARGVHQVGNALAALTVAGLCRVPLEGAAAALEAAHLSPWRMEVTRTAGGATVLNDAYNANPSSMAAALRALHQLPARRRTAVLGVMAELGPESASLHRAVAELAGSLGIGLVVVGTNAYGITPVAGIDAALAALGDIGPDDAVLVKGSRVAGLERLATRLVSG